jgi:hypothetical protein
LHCVTKCSSPWPYRGNGRQGAECEKKTVWSMERRTINLISKKGISVIIIERRGGQGVRSLKIREVSARMADVCGASTGRRAPRALPLLIRFADLLS